MCENKNQTPDVDTTSLPNLSTWSLSYHYNFFLLLLLYDKDIFINSHKK
jgi:hypothetical protein